MRRLTMTEFKRLCDGIKPVTYVFNTDNQEAGLYSDCSMVASYTEVITMLNPNRICFKSNNNYYCLNRVKYIVLLDDASIGYVFNIICGNRYDTKEDTTHVIIADKNF